MDIGDTKDPGMVKQPPPANTNADDIDKESVSAKTIVATNPESDQEATQGSTKTDPDGAVLVVKIPSHSEEKVKAEPENAPLPAGDPEREYITGIKLMAVLASCTLATFLMLLDMSIIATAIPRITSDFTSLGDVGWYGSAYQLANAAMQPLTGKLYNYFRTKWTFLVFFGFFELGSLVCGVASSSRNLIIGRAIAGLGGSGVYNGSLMIIAGAVPLHKRPQYIGIMMGLVQTGVVCGPLLGGAFTEYLTWRWCFYINLPIGVLVAGLILLIRIPEQMPKPKASSIAKELPRKLDLTGFALLAPASIQLLLALEYGGGEHPWNSPITIGLFCGAAATFAAFFWWNRRRKDEALIPVSLAGRRVIIVACLVMGLLMANVVTIGFFLPIYFQSVRNASPMTSGVYMLPIILSQLLSGVVSGFLVGRVGYIIPWAAGGSLVTAIGTGLLTTLTTSTPNARWIGFQILVGFGRGMVMQMPIVSIQNHLTDGELSVAMSLLAFLQNLMGSIFLVVSNTVFSNGLREQLTVQAPNVNATVVIAAGAAGIDKVVRPEDGQGVRVAYTIGVNRVFYVGVATVGMSFALSWLMGWKDIRKKKTPEETNEA